MLNDEEMDLTEAERSALAALPRERAPSELLEERITYELRSRGILAPRARLRRRVAAIGLRAAAAVFLFAAGVLTERFVLGGNPSDDSALTATRQTRATNATPRLSNEAAKPAQVELWI